MEPSRRTSEEYVEHLLGESGEEPIDKDVENVNIELPPWYDAELFTKGQKNYFQYISGMTSGMLVGLLAVLAIPSILKVLICSKKSGSPLDAYRRYLRTIYHVVSWHEFKMEPGTKAWQSITIVRKTHLASRKMCEHSQGITITQRDIALTQFGFLGFIALKPHMFGIPNKPEIMDPIVHLWRVIGSLMGLKDEFNLCTDSVETTKERLQIILDRVYRPALEVTDDDFNFMSKALIDGLWHSDFILVFNPYIHFSKRIAGCRGYEYFDSDFSEKPTKEDRMKLKYHELNWWERALLFYYIIVYEYLCSIAIFRFLYNLRMYIVTLLNFYLPLFPMYKFGIRKAYVRIFHGKSTEPNKHYD